jgi:hypothetical protein
LRIVLGDLHPREVRGSRRQLGLFGRRFRRGCGFLLDRLALATREADRENDGDGGG